MATVYEHVMFFKRKFHGGVSWRLKKHCDVIEHYLNPDEKVIFAFPAQKNDEVWNIFTTGVIALTNKRIIIAQKRVLWGYFYSSITPDLYNDLNIYQGLIWGKVTIDTVKEVVVLTNLPKSGLDEIETQITEYMMKEKKKYPRSENE